MFCPLTQSRIRLLLGMALCVAGLASVLLAAPPQDRRFGQPPIVRPIDRGNAAIQPLRIDSRDLQILRKPSKPFSPIEMVDPRTGRPVPPDQILRLGNGVRITAREYFAELNRIEKELNALGYSVRNAPDHTVIARVRIDPAKYRIVPSGRPMRGTAKPVVGPGVRVTVHDLERLVDQRSARLQKRSSTSEHRVRKTFAYTLGDTDILSASARGTLELGGKPDGVETRAEAAGGGTVFGHPFDALRVVVEGHSRAGGQSSAKMQMTALGATVFNVNKQGAIDETLERSRPLNLKYGADVPVGPFALAVELRVQGSVGALVHVSTAPASDNGDGAAVAMNFEPHIHTALTGTAAIDLKIASAGIEGKVDIINLDADARGGLQLVNRSGSPEVIELVSSSVDVSMLGGQLAAYAKVWNPFGKDKKWSVVLFDWAGIEEHIDLYNSFQTVELGNGKPPIGPVVVRPLGVLRERN